MNLYFARHGEMEAFDPERPLRDHGVSALGERQTVLLAERLAAAGPLSVYAGPSRRHAETAEVISDVLESAHGREIDVRRIEAFDDARWGTDALLRAEERALGHQEWIGAFVADDLPVEESFPEAQDRILLAWDEFRENRGGPALVVTSAIVVLIVVAEILDTPLDPPLFQVDNA